MSHPSPERTFQTERLILRCPEPGDGQQLFEAVADSLESLRAWPASLPWALQAPSAAASEAFCLHSAQAFEARTDFAFLVFLKGGSLIGSVGLHRVDWRFPKMEAGFWMRSGAQRQGHGKEALTALLQMAFERLGACRVEARTDEQNHACRATCLSAGLQLEGILRNERITPQGAVKNTCIYASVGID